MSTLKGVEKKKVSKTFKKWLRTMPLDAIAISKLIDECDSNLMSHDSQDSIEAARHALGDAVLHIMKAKMEKKDDELHTIRPLLLVFECLYNTRL